ncbi:hypothetical protein J7T55_005309 [Diaporthe amygdali]|uniref:uncharacterized protein n=1 Tax=Phomopsis amygdali TaxID=1214568 RepID=UPI0022FEA2B3|nr:uncharacterized protein J7T55_005309 [Diaporthe amygdali]KAJ0108332.1 hypothetical protein J7T55_005309 [Diaporthe amygdali]
MSFSTAPDPLDPEFTKDKHESQFTLVIQDLINGSIDPESAARTIDKIVVDECQEAFVSYTSVPNPTPEQLADGTILSPQPAGWEHFLWNCLGIAAMKLPADDASQDRLVSLVQELQRLPRHTVPWLAAGCLKEKELWNLSRENGYAYFKQWLWELHEGHFAGRGHIEKDTDASTAYLNFSSFLARLLASYVVDTTSLCALIRPSSFAKSPLPAQYEAYSNAGTQWIQYAGEALYEMCAKGALEIGKKRWTQGLWNSWKAKFAFIKDNDEFTKEGRERATIALDRMAQIETKGLDGIRGGVVEHFGFIIAEEQA